DVGALPFSPGCAIGGYLAIRSEIDPAPLLEALRAAGHALALPVIRADGETMDFRVWDRAVGLVRASFGLSVPPETAAIVEPRHLLVPLAAFDRRGFRLGYGKGHYDRALARLDASGPVVAVGVAFACQEVDRVPEEAHDRPLDCILTEREFIVAKGSA
ncbi:MAG: 5-formyltetrahydrofolate cyclo-ligase, partial [Ancalomicrobiaceae bacterium]|nr:5-formyltetrahydrofolate cyclo-ligase [Ancalomicrobiaceae bacterium]